MLLVATLLISGIVSLTVGGLLLKKPDTIIRLSELGNKVVLTDHFALAHRRPVGGLLIVLGALFLLFGTTAILS